MSQNNGQKQVSLAGAAGNVKPKRKRKSPWKAIGMVALLVVLLAAGVLAYQLFGGPDGPSLSAQEMVEYTVTPDGMSDSVSYFVLGVTGENPTDCLDMVAVMSYNRKSGSISVLQVPVSTYIGKDTGFAVNTVGNVWGSPQPEVFCSSCRVRVTAGEVEDNKHTVCGAKLENRTGSAYGDLIRVFNDQYGLPIDNFLVIPRAGLAQLVDALGGLDIKLTAKATLAGKSYAAGVQTLSGTEAVAYVTTHGYKNTPTSDRDRMLRQREFFAALLQRLSACSLEDLYHVDKQSGATRGILGILMNGQNPIRFNATSFGKARLLNISDNASNRLKLSDAMARFFVQISRVPLDKVTFSILPGEAVKSGTATVYSVNKAKTIELLNAQMNPYGLTLDDTTVAVPQLKDKPADSDASTATLDTVAQPQSGTVTTTTKATTTTTTLAETE